MAITHLVQFAYKPTVTAAQKANVANQFMALQSESRLAQGAGETFIVSVSGGKNNSPENSSKGLEHAFVVIFRNTEDRDYYLDVEPAHQRFKAMVGDYLADLVVVDFENAVF